MMENSLKQILTDKKLSAEKIDILEKLIRGLESIENVLALVLGGSYCTGNAHEDSDLDIGIYYSPKAPFSTEAIRELAKKFDTRNNPVVTDFYEWGPWVNGGAWIHHNNCKIDFLYRNIEQLKETIENAKNGIYVNNFEQQPPYGFTSVTYLAETQKSIVLYDPHDMLSVMKNEISVYPGKLKTSIIKNSLWSAEFTISHLDGFHKNGDVFNVMGCLTRVVKNFADVLYAINESYPMGYKRVVPELEKMEKIPDNLNGKIEKILCCNDDDTCGNIELVKVLFAEIVTLAEGMYIPKYTL